jgi:hypothetical protein
MSELEFAKTFWRGKMTFWAMSSQVMKYGSTNMILKRCGKVQNGRLPIPHNQKNFISPNQESRLLLTFFYIRGIIHVPTGQSTKCTMYLEALERLREKVRWKRPELVANNSWILHHDNAPPHTAPFVREFLATKQITVLEHPACSPDLAPMNSFCSQR